MRRSLRAAALVLAVVGLQTSLTGCFGKFALVRKVYAFNESVGDKWLRSLLTFALVAIPVYQVAGFFDYVILNVIEFWTGNNPASAALEPGQTREKVVVAADGTRLKMVIGDGGDWLRVEVARPGEAPLVMALRRTEDGAELRDGQGTLQSALAITESGSIEVRDGAGRLLLEKQPQQLGALASSLRQGGRALLAVLEVQAGSKLARAK